MQTEQNITGTFDRNRIMEGTFSVLATGTDEELNL
jgi:hypothetical protein